mgnify:CR=1 FL=1
MTESGAAARKMAAFLGAVVAVTSSLQERSDEAIHCSCRGKMDCFASLAMTGNACGA